MAGRFDFQAPSFNMAATIRKIIADRQADEDRQREIAAQAEAERVRAEDLKLRQAAETRAGSAEARARQLADTAQRRADVTDVESAVAQAGPGGALSDTMARLAARVQPSSIEQRMAPVPVAPNMGTMETGLPPVEAGSQMLPMVQPPPTTVSKGSRRQQVFTEIRKRPNLTDQQKLILDLVDASNDDNLPASAMAALFPEPNQRLFRRNAAGDVEESIAGKGWVAHQGDVPKNAKFVTEPQEPGAGGGSPYFIPIASGLGTVPFNARTGMHLNPDGSWTQDPIPLKPGEGALKEITAALGVGQQIDTIAREYNPDKIGVIMGRLKNLDQKYWGSDPDYARFKTELTTLGNQIIQLRTGAQMSIQEAQRILEEVARETLPVTTFQARLKRMGELYDEYLANRTKLAYGQLTPEQIKGMTQGRRPEETGTGTTPPPAAGADEWEEVAPGVKRRKRKAQ